MERHTKKRPAAREGEVNTNPAKLRRREYHADEVPMLERELMKLQAARDELEVREMDRSGSDEDSLYSELRRAWLCRQELGSFFVIQTISLYTRSHIYTVVMYI